jgi:plasmid maintenance system antidote protein VapI
MTKLKSYLKQIRYSQVEAAKELGLHNHYFNTIVNGKPAGKKTALKIQEWSKGKIKATELMGL